MQLVAILFPATAIAVAGYVVLYFAGRSDGGMKTFGRLLGGWTLLMAALLVVGVATKPLFGGRAFGVGPTQEERMKHRMEMRQKMMGGMMREGGMRPGMMRDGAMPPTPALPDSAATPPESPAKP